jgi:hypothetical protein
MNVKNRGVFLLAIYEKADMILSSDLGHDQVAYVVCDELSALRRTD